MWYKDNTIPPNEFGRKWKLYVPKDKENRPEMLTTLGPSF